MNFKIFVTLAGSAVLMAAVDVGNAVTSSTVAATVLSQGTPKATKPTTKTTPMTKLTTSQKATITCKAGNCTGAGCYNKTGFNTTTTCKSNQSCAVLEVTATKFTMSCQNSTQCKALEEKGTAACCEVGNCIPDLAKAKAKATAKNNGCVSLKMNMGLVLAIMAIMLPKII